jgi:hypothetical protein
MNALLSLSGLVLAPLVLVGQSYFYERFPFRANDVGAGPEGSVWIVGHGAAWANTDVYRWNGVGFEADGAAKGMSITVGADGLPWLVAADGTIYRKTSTAWQKVAGKGLDIAAGADGSVWLTGWPGDPVEFPTLSGPIYRWNGAGWTAVGGAARRISVAPDGQAWIVTGQGDIFRRAGDAWVKLPGRGSDIACGPDGSIWLIGYVPGGLNDRPLYRWDGANWVQPGGNGIRLAAGANGFPWLVASNGDVYRLHQLQTPQLVGTQAAHAGGVFQVTIPTQPGVTYSLRYKPDWTAPAWLTAETYRGDGLERTLRDVGAAEGQRIYRVDAAAP